MLDNLSVAMLHAKKAKAPKLKAQGAECRGLIPICSHLAKEMLDLNDPLEATIAQAMIELEGCYKCLSRSALGDDLASHSLRFATLLVTLEARHCLFRVKPKLHLFQELCEMQGAIEPAAHWTYRDEDFGGSIVAMAKSLGGFNSASATGKRVLVKLRARYSVPEFVG